MRKPKKAGQKRRLITIPENLTGLGGAISGPLANIHERIRELPRNQRGLAAFILGHLDEVAFLTAAKLAKRCGTSEATTIRFAKTLGFKGFPEFQTHIQTLVRQKLGPSQKMKRAGSPPTEIDKLFTSLAEMARNNLLETANLQSADALRNGAEAIVAAQHKYVIGLRGSAGTAKTLGFFLSMIQPNVTTLLEDGPVLLESLVSLNKDSVLVAISLPRYTRGTIEALRLARKCGARSIVITDSQLSPAAQIADIVLVVRADSFFNNSYVPVVFLVEALFTAVFSLSSESANGRLDAIERIFEGYEFFYTSPDLKMVERTLRRPSREED